MGVITLLRNVLGIAPDVPPQDSNFYAAPTKSPILKVEIYGPVGIRAFIRTVLTLTHTRSADRYCVHELLMPGETPSASATVANEWHYSELGGRDIPCDDDGFWRNIVIQERRVGVPVVVNAGPIVHRGEFTRFRDANCAYLRRRIARSMHWLRLQRKAPASIQL